MLEAIFAGLKWYVDTKEKEKLVISIDNVRVGVVVPCPKKVCETGFVRVVGDSSKCTSSNARYHWDFKCLVYDPSEPKKMTGVTFDVSREEMMEWLSNPTGK